LQAQVDTSEVAPAGQDFVSVAWPSQEAHWVQALPSPKKPSLQVQTETSSVLFQGHSVRVASALQAAHWAQDLPLP